MNFWEMWYFDLSFSGGKGAKQKTFKLSTSGCWSLQFLKKALKFTGIINGYMHNKQHLLWRRIYRNGGNGMNASHLDCPLTSCLNHLGRTWIKCCCRAWKKTDLSLRQRRRTSNALILLHQTMILDYWSARRSETAAKISATDLLLWI